MRYSSYLYICSLTTATAFELPTTHMIGNSHHWIRGLWPWVDLVKYSSSVLTFPSNIRSCFSSFKLKLHRSTNWFTCGCEKLATVLPRSCLAILCKPFCAPLWFLKKTIHLFSMLMSTLDLFPLRLLETVLAGQMDSLGRLMGEFEQSHKVQK